MAAKLKAGDAVIVICGKDKKVRGTIQAIYPKKRRAIVQEINVGIRHRKASEGQEGGRIRFLRSIDLSNLMLLDPSTNKPTRVGFRMEQGQKVRFAKKSGVVI